MVCSPRSTKVTVTSVSAGHAGSWPWLAGLAGLPAASAIVDVKTIRSGGVNFQVCPDGPAVERRTPNAPVEAATGPNVEPLYVERASAGREPLRQEVDARPCVEHELAGKIEHALNDQRGFVVEAVNAGPSGHRH
jgi:hypothetical protein